MIPILHRCRDCWLTVLSEVLAHIWISARLFIDGILPKGPYPPCLRMAELELELENDLLV